MVSKGRGLGCGTRGGFVLIGGFLVHLSLGSFFTFGNFSPYIISYMRNRTDEVNLRNVDGLWVSSIGAIGNFAGLTGGGILDKRFGPRVATAVGGAIFSSSVMLTSVTVKTSFNWVIVTYGIMFCLGMMMAYGPPVQTAIKWIPERPSLAAGLIVSGFGGGSLIFNQVITAYINPDNLAPDLITDDGERYFTDPGLLDRVPTCFLILGACYLGMQLIGIAMLTTPPSRGTTSEFEEDTNLHKNHVNEANETKEPNGLQLAVIGNERSNGSFTLSDETRPSPTTMNGSEKAYMEVKDPVMVRKGEYSIKAAIIAMFKCRSFYILWLTILCLECSLQYCNGLYKAYGQTFIKDDQFLAIVGSISSVFNSVFRPAWGLFVDRFGYKVSLWCITGGFTGFLATLLLTEYMGKPGFFVWICLIYGLSCGIWTVAPSTLARLFGASNMSVNYGFINLAISCGSIICGVTAITLKSIIGWHGIFFMAAGIGAVPFLLTFFFDGIDLNGKRI